MIGDLIFFQSLRIHRDVLGFLLMVRIHWALLHVWISLSGLVLTWSYPPILFHADCPLSPDTKYFPRTICCIHLSSSSNVLVLYRTNKIMVMRTLWFCSRRTNSPFGTIIRSKFLIMLHMLHPAEGVNGNWSSTPTANIEVTVVALATKVWALNPIYTGGEFSIWIRLSTCMRLPK